MTGRNGSFVRVMTWNIHGGVGPDGVFDLARVADLVSRHDPDIVALQEVDSRRCGPADPPPFAFLRGAIRRHGVDAKSITTADGDYGQMLASRWPVVASEIHDISYRRNEPRRAIETMIETPGGALRVVATHFGLGFRERRAQARAMVRLARNKTDHPMVMMGDFNDWAWPSSLRRALKRELPGWTPQATFPARWPLLGLDRIYCRPADMLKAAFTDPAARLLSDHLPMIADIALPASSRPAG
ncbi:MAG TPA: endonuclease/exonuclease/phosphatase family protein [Xanthobacteraceae bacterium]|nr:endonuclease/exonuclease/phosphatase family protein [Xanthobacteraceae bacterium]